MKYNNYWILLITGTIILSIIAIYNGYPLVYSDTGTYIYSGYTLFVPKDRPATYGLLLQALSMDFSLWFVIIFQNFIISFAILEVLKLFTFSNKNLMLSFLIIVSGLTAFTGIAWYSNQLMPDIFAPLSVLSAFILLINKDLPKWEKGVLYVIFAYSLITHYSHLLIAVCLIAALIILRIIWKQYFNMLSYKRLFIVLGISVFGWILLPSIHYFIEKEFVTSKSSHIFFMAHLAETGILKEFLDKNCHKEPYQGCELCKHKDELPETVPDFIWYSGIVKKTGGWENSKLEYSMIIRDIMSTPEYFLLNAVISIKYGFIQLTQNKVGEGLSPYKEGTAPHMQIEWHFPEKEKRYLESRQNQGRLGFSIISLIQTVLIILSLMICAFAFITRKRFRWNSLSVVLLIFVFLSIFINSLVTAGLSAPYARYQARVIWLLPFATAIFAVINYKTLLSGLGKTRNTKHHE